MALAAPPVPRVPVAVAVAAVEEGAEDAHGEDAEEDAEHRRRDVRGAPTGCRDSCQAGLHFTIYGQMAMVEFLFYFCVRLFDAESGNQWKTGGLFTFLFMH